jgi:5-formyltetrahydrofolate cyclo-ligase
MTPSVHYTFLNPSKQTLVRELKIRRKKLHENPREFEVLQQILNVKLEDFIAERSKSHAFEVASFLPFGSELDPNLKFLGERWFPKMASEQKLLWFKASFSEAAKLSPNPQGIKEADENLCQMCNTHKNNPWLVIVPALAVDTQFRRLGYGGGYYDRFIATHRDSIYTVVCIPDAFFYDELPHEAHDEKIDVVITETKTLISNNFEFPSPNKPFGQRD